MNWNMCLFVCQCSQNYLSNLSKIAVISLGFSDVYLSGFEHIFASKETSYAKVSNLYE